MSWVPRFPEVKANLGLSNGEFGTYLSLGSVGAVIAMLSSGHFVHKLGAKPVLIISTLTMCLSISTIVHLQSTPIFIIANMINGGSIAAFNIALNAQAFHAQDRSGELILSRQHGYWTIGAVTTAIISGSDCHRDNVCAKVLTMSKDRAFNALGRFKVMHPNRP